MMTSPFASQKAPRKIQAENLYMFASGEKKVARNIKKEDK